jgi:hypothetical protein
MKISSLKAILEELNDNDEVVVAITVNDNKVPIITYDIGFGISEHKELMFEVNVHDADFDY